MIQYTIGYFKLAFCLMNATSHITQIKKALPLLKLEASDAKTTLWLEYLSLLKKWNKTYNMTAITDFDEMLVLHLYDSLSVAPYLVGKRTVDVGTGGGLPGVVLAILYPEHEFILIDSIGKKIKFLNHVKYSLKLKNIFPMQTRVEAFQPEEKFDNVISRAFTSLDNFYDLCKHLPNENGQFLAMKGQLLAQELESFKIKEVESIPLKVPFLEAERHLVRFYSPI